jgi:hypothetical protein
VKRLVPALLCALPAAGWAEAQPAEGVKYDAPRGIFARTGFGVFTSLGGKRLVEKTDGSGLEFSPRVSNAQPFMQIQVGYDIFMGLSASLGYARGENGDLCFNPNTTQLRCEGADNFSLNFLEAGVDYAYPLPALENRLSVHGGLLVGYAMFSPDPRTALDNAGAPVITGPGAASSNSVHLGAAAGAVYDTRLRGFSVSADVGFRLVAGVNIPSLSFAGAIKYVF